MFQRMKSFYDQQYRSDIYSTEEFSESRAAWVQDLLHNYSGNHSKIRVLEIGSGRGYLQDTAPGYVGLDISLEAGRQYTKPFVSGLAEALPFADQTFDVVMSFTVLEHLTQPELALMEMDRVLKKKGVLVVSAAWRVPPWRPLGLEERKYQELPLQQKMVKSCLPIMNSLWTKGILRLPLRALRELRYFFRKSFCPLPYTRMTPNWEIFLLPDSDAAASLDNHACALWFFSRGFRSPDTQTPFQRILLRCGPLIMMKS